MNPLRTPFLLAAAVGVAAFCSTAIASAQQSVVVQPSSPPPAPAPAPAPVVVQPAPAQAPTVVEHSDPPAESGPNVVVQNHASAPADADRGGGWRPNRALLMTGLILGGVPYIASATVAGTSGHSGDSDLWIPVVGPWLDLGQRGGCPANGSCGGEVGNKALLVGDGILQGAGVLEIAGSFLFPETVHVTTVQTGKNSWFTLTPARVASTGYGISAFGQF